MIQSSDSWLCDQRMEMSCGFRCHVLEERNYRREGEVVYLNPPIRVIAEKDLGNTPTFPE